MQTQSPFRDDVTDDVIARNPPRFAKLMHRYGAFPFRTEDIDRERTALGGVRHSLFDTLPLWREFYDTGDRP